MFRKRNSEKLFLEGLKSHKCSMCKKCCVCHNCLLARGYLRNEQKTFKEKTTYFTVPANQISGILDALLRKQADNEPPKYITVGPNNEVCEIKDDNVGTNDSCSTDEAPEAQDNLDENVEKGEVYECDVCKKVLSTEKNLKIHKVYHSYEGKYQCKICDKTFKYSYELIKHEVFHTAKTYKCEICEKVYYDKEKLDLHSRYHTGARPFACNVCGKTYRHNWLLKKHSLKHSGELPFPCTECGKRFIVKHKLRQHEMIHQGIMPFSCIVCEKRFRHKCNLKTHLLKHHNMESNDIQVEKEVEIRATDVLAEQDAAVQSIEEENIIVEPEVILQSD